MLNKRQTGDLSMDSVTSSWVRFPRWEYKSIPDANGRWKDEVETVKITKYQAKYTLLN